MSVAIPSTPVKGVVLTSARTTPNQSCLKLAMFLTAPFTILRSRSAPSAVAPSSCASSRRLPVPQKGSRKTYPGLTLEKFTSARESLGKMAAG